MNNNVALSEQLRLMTQKARRSIKAAYRNIDEGDYDFASSRAYYAAFYAMEAVLLTRNLTFSKHSGVISAFNKNFVKPGLFPKNFSKNISRLFRERETGDYDFVLSIRKEDASENAAIAEKIVDSIENYLKKEGFL